MLIKYSPPWTTSWTGLNKMPAAEPEHGRDTNLLLNLGEEKRWSEQQLHDEDRQCCDQCRIITACDISCILLSLRSLVSHTISSASSYVCLKTLTNYNIISSRTCHHTWVDCIIATTSLKYADLADQLYILNVQMWSSLLDEQM